LGFIKNTFVAHQGQLQAKTGRPENPQEVEFAAIDRKVCNKFWFHGAGRVWIDWRQRRDQGFVASVVGVMQVKAPNTAKSAGLVVSRDRIPA
jgi:hypothetical protein